MNQLDLIDAIAKDTGASKAATKRFLDSLTATVQKEVATGGVILIAGFGSFRKVAVPGRIHRNPKTGTLTKTASTYKAKFTPGINFKHSVKDW